MLLISCGLAFEFSACSKTRAGETQAANPTQPADFPNGTVAAAVSPKPSPKGAPAEVPKASVEARRARVRAAILQGKIEEGVTLLKALWEEAPGEARAQDLTLRAAIYSRQDKVEAALQLMQAGEAAKLGSASMADLAAALGTNISKPATRAIELQRELKPAKSAATAALFAHLYERAHDPRGAIPFWELASKMAPSEATYLRERVRLYAATAQNRKLETTLRQLLPLAPNDLSVRINLVRMLVLAGRKEEALAQATPKLGALPEPERSLTGANVLLRARLPDDALAHYRSLLEQRPLLCEARFGEAKATLATGARPQGQALMLALVKQKVGTTSCHVAEAARSLFTGPEGKSFQRKLKRLLARGGGADPESLKGVLAAVKRSVPASKAKSNKKAEGLGFK